MIDTSLLRRPALAAALDPVLVERRRALPIAPPEGFAEMLAEDASSAPVAGGWRDDLRFFLGCYAAGLVFFLIILS